MKKIQLFLLAAMLIGIGSAFTQSRQVADEYFTTNGTDFELKGSGECINGSYYCTYNAIVENPRLDHPEDFEPVGPSGKLWQESVK